MNDLYDLNDLNDFNDLRDFEEPVFFFYRTYFFQVLRGAGKGQEALLNIYGC